MRLGGGLGVWVGLREGLQEKIWGILGAKGGVIYLS